MNLSTRVDIANTELKALKTQESWLSPDLQEIQVLNEELLQNKEELQRQISLQANEIEILSNEIKELREEVDRLNRVLDGERQKNMRSFQQNLS